MPMSRTVWYALRVVTFGIGMAVAMLGSWVIHSRPWWVGVKIAVETVFLGLVIGWFVMGPSSYEEYLRLMDRVAGLRRGGRGPDARPGDPG